MRTADAEEIRLARAWYKAAHESDQRACDEAREAYGLFLDREPSLDELKEQRRRLTNNGWCAYCGSDETVLTKVLDDRIAQIEQRERP